MSEPLQHLDIYQVIYTYQCQNHCIPIIINREIRKKGSVSRLNCKMGSVWNKIVKMGRVVRREDDIKVKSSSQRPVSFFFFFLNEVVRPPVGFCDEVVRQGAGFSFWFFFLFFSLQFYFMIYKFLIFSFFNHLHFLNFCIVYLICWDSFISIIN